MPTKLVVWDGDETLWHGTITEGDIRPIPGRAALCNRLCQAGALQCVASSNLIDDVLRSLHYLELDKYFLVVKADLVSDKVGMIKEIMEELGLVKYEEVVFVDDSAVNRAMVSEILGVTKSIHPDSADELLLFFPAVGTPPMVTRTDVYRSEIRRKEAGRAYAGDKISFFRSCSMCAEIRLATLDDVPRVTELVDRANQMAAAERDYDQGLLGEAASAGHLYIMSADDKYGKYGLTGAAIRNNSGHISLLVISCRLQGKGYGSALLGWLCNLGSVSTATWRITRYNEGVKSLYQWYSYETSVEGQVCQAKLETSGVSLPDWISITTG